MGMNFYLQLRNQKEGSSQKISTKIEIKLKCFWQKLVVTIVITVTIMNA